MRAFVVVAVAVALTAAVSTVRNYEVRPKVLSTTRAIMARTVPHGAFMEGGISVHAHNGLGIGAILAVIYDWLLVLWIWPERRGYGDREGTTASDQGWSEKVCAGTRRRKGG